MKRFIKNNLKVFVTLIISAILFTGIGVYAASQYYARDITFTPTNENFKKENGEPITNVEDALNTLYNKNLLKCDSLVGTTWNYGFQGEEQLFVAPCDGVYKLEVWGAQGGSYNSIYIGGYGAYSHGLINFDAKDKAFIVVGGQGQAGNTTITSGGGYNGGGNAHNAGCKLNPFGGGGATHIATSSGLLSSFDPVNELDKILIVAGGGAGAYSCDNSGLMFSGNSAGGFQGNGENVYINYAFGKASADEKSYSSNANYAGGGGGFYGGNYYWDGKAGGGSSYIGNDLLVNKEMYCYKCTPSDDVSTLTKTVNESNIKAVEYQTKQGNGYARITLLSVN